jgi:hypothetical protein
MAQTGFTPIQIYSSSTAAAAPTAGNLTNSTLGSELAINITDGKLFYKDNANAIQVIGWKVVPTSAGGTGLTSYTAGDLTYYASGTAFTKLAIGASGRYLSSSGTAPQWTAPAALTKTDDTNVTLTLGGSASTALLNAASITVGWTGALATGRGGTGQSTYTAGDLLYYASGTALTKLGIGAANTVLTSSGSAPQWSSSLALGGSFSCASNALVGTTSTAGIIGNGLSVNSGAVGTSGFTAALSLTGSGGDFYAQNYRDSAGNCFYDLAIFSAATDLMARAYRTSGGTVTNIFYAYANGNFEVVGALSKGSGSFRIEHPHPELSPTHELVHSFIEGPQADLIYRGQVVLQDGKAQINIDQAASMKEGTFVLLCRDVQCFTSNETDWDNVRGKVSGNILTIESQNATSNATISWMVVGERQDKHMMDTDWTDDTGKVIVEPLKRVKPTIEV